MKCNDAGAKGVVCSERWNRKSRERSLYVYVYRSHSIKTFAAVRGVCVPIHFRFGGSPLAAFLCQLEESIAQ